MDPNSGSRPRTFHVLTVHWQDPRWVGIQLAALRRHLDGPVRLWSFLNGFEDSDFARWAPKFDYASRVPIVEHEFKLNLLADLVSQAAAPDDVLIFVDGDAFPVAPLREWVEESLGRQPLLAVQRRENLGDCQPHPCFAATTVEYWNRIGGDWQEGATWTDCDGREITDVGGNLLAILEARGDDWLPVLRSNVHDIHPVMFGVYGGVIYHHGAGFYPTIGQRLGARAVEPHAEMLDRRMGSRLRMLAPRIGPGKEIRKARPAARMRREVRAGVAAMSSAVFAEIEADENFHRGLTEPESDSPLAGWRLEPVPAEWARRTGLPATWPTPDSTV